MNNQLSIGEWICQDFGRYLKHLEAEGRCLFLQHKLQSLDLIKIGRFDEKHLDFDDVNVIHGDNGTGKTTLLQAVSSVIGYQVGVKAGQDHGEINLTLSDGSVLHQDIFNSGSVRSIVLDNACERLDQEHYGEFLRYLRDLDVQVILTRGNMNDELVGLINRTFPDCTFIQLN